MEALVTWVAGCAIAIAVGTASQRLADIRDELTRIGDKLQAILAVMEERER